MPSRSGSRIERMLSFAKAVPLLRGVILLAVLLVMTPVDLPAGVLAAEPLPGFGDRLVVTVYGGPTDLAWLGGDLLIATENGWLFRLPASAPPAAPLGTATMILDLTSQIGQGREQGLLGVVADPDYPARPYVYVFYTRAPESGHCGELPTNCTNRVSRFTMGSDGLLDPDSEVPLLDSIMVGSLHNAGDLAFDSHDLLYVSTGDAGHWMDGQDLTNLNGKILRITRDGDPAPGNPFSGPGTQACDERGPGITSTPCPEIFAYGLRNPFRIAFDPGAQTPSFYINDVGQEGWEEIDAGQAGADYGWPMREGPCATQSSPPCEPSTNLVEPVFAYAHETGCFAITGGAFVPAWSAWGAAYRQTYLFADWGCGSIFILNQGADGLFTATRLAGEIHAITALLFSPDGRTLYYAYEEPEGSGHVGALWRCPTRSMIGLWPPSCLWGSAGWSAPAGE